MARTVVVQRHDLTSHRWSGGFPSPQPGPRLQPPSAGYAGAFMRNASDIVVRGAAETNFEIPAVAELDTFVQIEEKPTMAEEATTSPAASPRE
jgi:hypothetical protein